MFGDAFVVVDSNTEAYTMWFFNDTNPNDNITSNIKANNSTAHNNLNADDKCHL